jgi:hypothetical protein
MLLFNTCLLYNQLCVSFICGRARLPPPPHRCPHNYNPGYVSSSFPILRYTVHYVHRPTLRCHVCPLQRPENVCTVCFLCQAAPSVYLLPLGRGLLCPCLPRSTVVALRGLEAGRQSRLHLCVVHSLVILCGSSRNTVAWLNRHAPRHNRQENASLSVGALASKLATLLSLATLYRASQLAGIEKKNQSASPRKQSPFRFPSSGRPKEEGPFNQFSLKNSPTSNLNREGVSVGIVR